MNLSEFTIKNYKSLREVKVDLRGYTAFIGKNGSGKTSMLEALYLFFKDFSPVGGTPSPILQQADSWHSRNLPLEFIARIVLDDGECRDILPEDILDKIIAKYAGQHRELTIHRRIRASGSPWETLSINIAKVTLVKDDAAVSLEDWGKPASKAAPNPPTGKLKAFLFDPDATQSNLIGDRLVVLNDTAYEMDDYTDSLVREGKIPFEQLPGEDYEAWAANQGLTLEENPLGEEDIDALLGTEVPSSGAEKPQQVQAMLAQTIKGKLKFIPATRDERVEPGERASFLGSPTIVDPLKALHTTDADAWFQIGSAVERLIAQRLDSVPVLSTWEQNLRLPVSLIGGGQQEIIGLLYQIYTATEPIVAIEEPEIHLHDSLSRELFGVLRGLATMKQLIVATHSEYFADLSGASRNWVLEKKGKESKAREITHEQELIEAFGSLGAKPSDRGYPNKILFVAGETEASVLPIWAATLGANLENVRIDPLKGEYDKRRIPTIMKYIDKAQTTAFLMLDSHASSTVQQALDEEHRLILEGTIEDCYPIPVLVQALNKGIGLRAAEGDIDPAKPRVDEIKRLLKDKFGIPRAKTFWKLPVGTAVARQMSKDDIPEKIRGLISKIAS